MIPLVGAPWVGPPAPPLLPLWAVTRSPYPVWNVVPWPTYVYIGNTTTNRPQLVFNDGTTYIVKDYWRVDDQLHFVTIEEGGTKLVEHTAPFGNLDVQRTAEADQVQGFRFVLRDEPIEQWLQDHPPMPAPR